MTLLVVWHTAALAAVAQLPSSPTTRPGDPRSSLALVGDRDQLFAARYFADMPSGTLVFRRATGANTWVAFSRFAGAVADVTMYRGSPAVLSMSGTPRAVFEGGSAPLALPPSGHRLLHLSAGGPDGRVLYALSFFESRLRLLRLDFPQGGLPRWTDLGPTPPDAPVPLASPEESVYSPVLPADLIAVGPGALVLAVTQSDGKIAVYEAISPLPAWATVAPTTRGTTRATTQPTTLASTAPVATAPATEPATELTAQPLTWKLRTTLSPVEPKVSQLRWLDLTPTDGPAAAEPAVALWVDPGDTDGGSLYTSASGFDVAKRVSMGTRPGEIATAAGRIRFVSLDAENRATEQVYDLSGTKLGEPISFDPGGPASVQQRIQSFVTSLALAGLLLGVLLSWRRRGELTPETIERAYALPLASRGRRLLAGLIDASPWIVTTVYLIVSGQITLSSGLASPMTPRVLFIELVAIAFVVTHTLLAEVIAGRSLGKQIVGLRVVTLTGSKPAPGSVVVRSLFRFTDLLLMGAPLLSILFSPLRQSLGDSASGTVVVDVGASEKRPPDESADHPG